MKVNKQKMLSHIMNDGREILGSDGCRCIKGAFIDALVDPPQVPDEFLQRYPHMRDKLERYIYNLLYTGYEATPWRDQYPELCSTLDHYEAILFKSKAKDRQEILKQCVDSLEGLVEWEQSCVERVLVTS